VNLRSRELGGAELSRAIEARTADGPVFCHERREHRQDHTAPGRPATRVYGVLRRSACPAIVARSAPDANRTTTAGLRE
jgi:hypothetical protein